MAVNRVQIQQKARVYAQAMLDVAKLDGEEGLVNVGKNLDTIMNAVLADSSLTRAIANNEISRVMDDEQALQFVKQVFKGLSPNMHEILKVMTLNGDLNLAIKVAEQYQALLYKDYNIAIAKVTTVVELDDHLRKLFVDKLSSELNCKVYLAEFIDKQIVGGFIVEVLGRCLDCCVGTKLKEVHNELTRYQVAN